jgi:hypothetical protein
MFNRGNGRLYLGQLVESTQGSNDFINTSGLKVNNVNLDQNTLEGAPNNNTGQTNKAKTK